MSKTVLELLCQLILQVLQLLAHTAKFLQVTTRSIPFLYLFFSFYISMVLSCPVDGRFLFVSHRRCAMIHSLHLSFLQVHQLRSARF